MTTLDASAASQMGNNGEKFKCSRTITKSTSGTISSVSESFFVRQGQPDVVDATTTVNMDASGLHVASNVADMTVTVQGAVFETVSSTFAGGVLQIHETVASSPALVIELSTSDGQTFTGTINGRTILPWQESQGTGSLRFADGGPLPS
ncbi:MAG: hypothetical protein ACREJ3_02635, partial [Polyangiaceae bacterium]